MRNISDMQKSPVEFSVDVDRIKKTSPVIVPLEDLLKLSDNQNISIKIKVTKGYVTLTRVEKARVQSSRCPFSVTTC